MFGKLDELKQSTPTHILYIVERVWSQRDRFIKWPKCALVFMPNQARDQEYYKYTTEQKAQLKAAGIKADARSNGPAIMAYLLAGGERPQREASNHKWPIHHIYDGKFPISGRSQTTHAVKNPQYFTASEGLVAIHPIANALADEVPYFSWLLRSAAFEHFGFDPDNVFNTH